MRSPHHHGMSTLFVVIALFFVTALAGAFANRHLLTELRVARLVGDDRRAQVAAEQGLERALTLMNGDSVDDECQATPSGHRSAMDRWIRPLDSGHLVSRLDAQDATVLLCDRDPTDDWRCRCAGEQAPVGRAAEATPSSSVRVALQPVPSQPGQLWLAAHGCAEASARCEAPAPTADASQGRGSQRHMQVALLPALRQVPSAALVAGGAVDLGDGMAVVNTDAATGGVALRSGGRLAGSDGALIGPNGARSGEQVLSHDTELAQLRPQELLRRLVGMSIDVWTRHPALRVLRCEARCDASSVAALFNQGARFVWVDGSLRVDREVQWGEPERPLALLVGGDLDWSAPSRWRGALLVAGEARLSGGTGQARFDGGVVVGGGVRGDASVQIVHQAKLLRLLQHQVGSFVRVPGSSGAAP